MKKKRKKTYLYALNGRFEQLKVDYIPTQTRSQAVARIADRTTSQQTVYKLAIVAKSVFSCFQDIGYWASRVWFSGSRDVIGRLTIRFPIGHFLLAVLWNQAFMSNGFGDIQLQRWRNGWYDVKRPLNICQGYSFLYQSLPHIRFYV